VKKLAAILFLTIMLFNGFGYRWVANYFDQKAAEHLVTLIDQNDFDEASLITIKTSINLPYYSNNPKFERVDGEMVINGIVYQYVQRRVFNDSLEIKVLPNQDRLHIKNAREDFYKLAQDLQQKGADKKSLPIGKSSAKFISFDYIQQDPQWSIQNLASHKLVFGSQLSTDLLSTCLSIQGPPPKSIA
jgi:hypothetical protein